MVAIKNVCQKFFKEKLTYDAKLLYLLLLLNFALGITLIMTNDLTHHYVGIVYFTGSWQRVIVPLLLLSLATLYFQDIVPARVSLMLFVFSLYALSLCAGLVLTQGIETTPFTPVDTYLKAVDHCFDFNQTTLLKIIDQHPVIKKIFMWGYDSLIPELIVLPLLLAFFLDYRATYQFLTALLISYPIGTLIFYFFPTTAPASIMHSAFFTFQEHDTYIKFYEIHHYMKLTTDEGGLIAFPSFHVIWGVLLVYLTHSKKWIFYPVLCWNSIMIGSTVTLGWHYLVDVISGILLAILSLLLAEYGYLMTRKCGGLLLAGEDDGGGTSSVSSSSSLKTIPRPFSNE